MKTTSFVPDEIQYPAQQSRVLTAMDFPSGYWGHSERSALASYLYGHNTTMEKTRHTPNLYPTERGICFILTGVSGARAYTERLIPQMADGTRFYNPKGVNMGDFCWVARHASNPIQWVITEGPMDAARAYQCGYSAISILGANFTEARADLIKRILSEQVGMQAVYIPDSDGPGCRALQRLTNHRVFVPIMFLPMPVKDLSDLTDRQAKDFLSWSMRSTSPCTYQAQGVDL
jgi:hypothetical protein